MISSNTLTVLSPTDHMRCDEYIHKLIVYILRDQMMKLYLTLIREGGLFDSENCDSSVIFCKQLTTRMFGALPSAIELILYRDSLQPQERCLYEVIRGTRPQKPYFDIDSSPDEAKSTALRVLDCIPKLFPGVLSTDIMLFTSSSESKGSYHIIVDRWMVLDHRSAKAFALRVAEHIESSAIDLCVYSKLQQLRLNRCSKFGSPRVKIIDPCSPWIGDNEDMSSLVSETSTCKLIPDLTPSDPLLVTSSSIPENVIDKVKTLIDLSVFSVRGPCGPFIHLKRKKPSFCESCMRIHEHENPYLRVASDSVLMYCRRGTRPIILGGERKKPSQMLRDLD